MRSVSITSILLVFSGVLCTVNFFTSVFLSLEYFGRAPLNDSRKYAPYNKTGVDNVSLSMTPEGVSMTPQGISNEGPCCSWLQNKSVADIFKITSMCNKYLGSGKETCKCGKLLACKVVVVTALSDYQYKESLGFLSSIQQHLPHTPIVVYDLGLSAENRKSLASFCQVHVNNFSFHKYPPHVKNLAINAWKPIVIAEMSKTYEVVLWCDSKCRLQKRIWSKMHYLTHYPIIPVFQADHPFISTLHENSRRYLGLNFSRKHYSSIKISLQVDGILWLNEELRKHLLHPWLDCALHEECIAPAGTRYYPCSSNLKSGVDGDYVGCHKFDQVTYNAILTREYGMRFINYLSTKKIMGLTRVEKIPPKERNYYLKVC